MNWFLSIFDNNPYAFSNRVLIDLLEVYIQLRGREAISESFFNELREATTNITIPRDNGVALEIESASPEVKAFIQFAHAEFKTRVGHRHYSDLVIEALVEHRSITSELVFFRIIKQAFANLKVLQRISKLCTKYLVVATNPKTPKVKRHVPTIVEDNPPKVTISPACRERKA